MPVRGVYSVRWEIPSLHVADGSYQCSWRINYWAVLWIQTRNQGLETYLRTQITEVYHYFYSSWKTIYSGISIRGYSFEVNMPKARIWWLVSLSNPSSQGLLKVFFPCIHVLVLCFPTTCIIWKCYGNDTHNVYCWDIKDIETCTFRFGALLWESQLLLPKSFQEPLWTRNLVRKCDFLPRTSNRYPGMWQQSKKLMKWCRCS